MVANRVAAAPAADQVASPDNPLQSPFAARYSNGSGPPPNPALQGTIELLGNNLHSMRPHPTDYPGVVLPRSFSLRLRPAKLHL
jgi:hypothetical protein